ncbi:MAG: hypothetical protein PHZ09_04140 [Eubacteriales bacterium]|nr:hypothetical protein [Eubacteriales bacterium]
MIIKRSGVYNMVEVRVNPGACGLKSIIKSSSRDKQNTKQNTFIEIISDCPDIQAMVRELSEVDAYEECFSHFGESKVYESAKKILQTRGLSRAVRYFKGY